MLGRLLRFARTSRRDPKLVLLALRVYFLLVLSRVVITVLPMRRITGHLGEPMVETPLTAVHPSVEDFAHRVGVAIRKIAPATPTESNCYPQALTAWWLLHRKGAPTTFYFGAAFERGKPDLAAHVWLRCGTQIVTGGRAGVRFQALTYYADFGRTSREVGRKA